MGFFSSIGNAIGGIFGGGDSISLTGTSSALRLAEQQSAQQQAQFQEIMDLIRPGVETGLEAQQQLSGFATPEGIGQLLTDIQTGPAFSALADPITEERGRAAEAALSAAGLRRSGGAIREAANIPTDVRTSITQSLLDRVLGTTGNVSQLGGGFLGGTLSALQGFGQAGQGAVEAALAGAQGRTGILSGLLGLGGSLGAASLLSDPRLKMNAHKIGEYNGMGVYEWDWIPELADRIGEDGSKGFMADEVYEKHPECINMIDLDGMWVMTVDYPVLCEKLRVH